MKLRERTFLDPRSVDFGRPVERTVIELEDNSEITRFCDIYDLRAWHVYDIVFRALPGSKEDYRRVFGGLSYSQKSERHLMPTSFDEAYALAEEWIVNGKLPKNIKGHHIRHDITGQYDALTAYTDEWRGDNMVPAKPGSYEQYRLARSGRQ